MQDPIVQTKTCRHCQSMFDITQGDMDFYAKISPTFAGQTFQIPTPTLCPTCRQRRRLAFRNERNLYRRICDASGKQIISIYSPDKPYKVYDQKIWRSDSWDPMEYGRVFDFSQSFFSQLALLHDHVPKLSLDSFGNENADYTNQSAFNKNCYLSFHVLRCNQCLYVHQGIDSTDCVDGLKVAHCQNCYHVVHVEKCFDCYEIMNCTDCVSCYYSSNLIGCTHCIDCDGLVNQSYCIHNQNVTKSEFDNHLRRFHGVVKPGGLPMNYGCESSDGYDIQYCYNVHESYDVAFTRDAKYCNHLTKMDSINVGLYDISFFGEDLEGGYEGTSVGAKSFSLFFCNSVWRECAHMRYSLFCFNGTTNSFGCVGLRNKQYCIFNKQYTKEEYEKIVARIIAHMQETGERGEFFHPSLSPFGYNETVAQEYYPTKVESGKLKVENSERDLFQFGYKRSTYESPKPVSGKVIKGADLPESIDEVDDSILQYAIECAVTGKLFRIQPQELAFYRKHHIPLPRKHPDQRHLERLALRR